MNVRLEDSELLEDWAKPSAQIALYRRGAPTAASGDMTLALSKAIGPWSSLPDVFLNFAKDNPEWADVVALLPVRVLKEITDRTTTRLLQFCSRKHGTCR